MNLHEYQAKIFLKQFKLPIVPFAILAELAELKTAVETLGLKEAVLKVQVHAGGRGKAGGVVIAKSPEAIAEAAKRLLFMKIVNNQTGKEGVVANELLISPLISFKSEAYMGVIVDRKKAQVTIIASPEGGMDIEEIAEKFPEKIGIFPVENNGKIRTYNLVKLAKFMGWKGETAKQGKAIAQGLAQAFFAADASLLEINPLVETEEGALLLLDAKLSLDENGLFRHPDLAKFYDSRQLPETEARAKAFDLAYVALDGSIGCMVNGAGLAMATMDIIHYYGGSPANFLDVGGGASEEKVAEGFKIILADKNVKAIFVNIFGGIMNCKTLAAGIISAVKEQKLTLPLIVRMEGTNVEEGKAMLAASQLEIMIADGLGDGAEKAVQAAKNS
ncbi:MAG: ADP-forming succinate--CoA ligase subunit beta [Parachlamydiaceae bacterium]|nr:ADP-forming succinate--CoA ligase subunit beta [Parachlamydiaceae bacterium]